MGKNDDAWGIECREENNKINVVMFMISLSELLIIKTEQSYTRTAYGTLTIK